MNAGLFHQLEGEKVYFKALNINDAEEIHSYASDEDVSRFIGWKLMHSLEETRNYIEVMLKREQAETHLYASVVLKKTDKIIGTAMLFNFDREAKQAEIGYVFHKDYWGKGYGTEAIALISKYSFEAISLHRLNASVVDTNIASGRVLEKNGFQLEGRFRDYYYIDDKYYDGLFYGRLR